MELVFVWIVCAFIGAAIGGAKNRAGTGFLLGLVLGFIGVIIIAVMPGEKKAIVVQSPRVLCPYCRSHIDPQAVICPQCRSSLSGPPPAR